MRTLFFKLLALLLAAAGTAFLGFGVWILSVGVAPQVLDSGWALSGDNLILNRNWQGNQLYLLVFLYFGFGLLLMAGSVLFWRRGRARSPCARRR